MLDGGGGARSASRPRSVLLAGATGLVGVHVLRKLGEDRGVDRIEVPVRRPIPVAPAKARVRVVDFSRLADHPELFRVDQLFICLGTTIKKAGSQEAFRAVDFDLEVEMARRAKDAGAEACLMISSIGADPSSRVFYSRVKGEAEEAVKAMGWRKLAILRPSLLFGDRKERRPAEKASMAVAKVIGPLMRGPLARYRGIEGSDVAEAMARLSRREAAGTTVYDSSRRRRSHPAHRPLKLSARQGRRGRRPRRTCMVRRRSAPGA